METDAELVRRCLRGEMAAFGTLVERHRAAVTGFCCRQAGDFDTAEDLAQETFLRAYFDLHALRVPESFGSWLRVIALRLCQSWRRRRHEAPLPLEELACSTGQRSPEGEVLDRWMAQEALALLPQAQRIALTLRYWEGYSLIEIAALTHVPVETVRTRLRRARHRLREADAGMLEAFEGEITMKRREFVKQAGAVGATAMASGAIPIVPIPPSPGDAAFVRRVLEKLELVQMEAGLTGPLYTCLRALRNDWSLPFLMGVTGMAFQFTVDERVRDTGPTDVMDWSRWFDRLHRLGQEVTVFNAQLKSFSPTVKTDTEEEFRACQMAAWDAVRASLDRGVPAISWMPVTREQKERGEGCEYALLVGYDTEAGLYHVRVPGRAMWTIPWDGFGRADPVNWFNVSVFGEAQPVDEQALVRDALQFAVEHARSARPGHGLGAYETWRQALQRGTLSPTANPRAARIVREARAAAAGFLQETARRVLEVASGLAEAGGHYTQVARSWEEYIDQLPHSPASDARETALRILQAARDAETAGVSALEQALARLTAT
jgi:RNA polymerase sigma-70 factor (ECF subfamily)